MSNLTVDNLFQQALSRHGEGQLLSALLTYDRVIAMQPDHVEAHNNRGAVLQKLKCSSGALSSYQKAISLQPGRSDLYVNQGHALIELDLLEEALVSFSKALELRPGHVSALLGRGSVLTKLNRCDEALACYDHALVIKPQQPTGLWNKALLKIKTGHYAEGWRLYESGWSVGQRGRVRSFDRPLWLGDQDIRGATLLIHAEQGLGDFIQFCRFIPLLLDRGADVVLETPQALLELMQSLDQRVTVVEKGRPLPDFDLYCPIMSLPLAFGLRLETIPTRIPYLFANPNHCETWTKRLGEASSRPRIGVVCSGNPKHRNDRHRSLSLSLLDSLFCLPAEFHLLQKVLRGGDLEVVARWPNLHAHHGFLHGFAETAALIQEMDLVISVDTAVAHLAGAMGKEVWILLPYAPDYRWMLGRPDSPWYPTACLLRQPDRADWRSVIAEVAKRIEAK